MLNHAAAETSNRSALWRGQASLAPALITAALTTAALATAALTMMPGTALALDGIDLSSEPEPVAEGECPRLIQIKYPFLSCASGQIGLSDADETWETERRMIRQGDWTESDAGWRPYRLNPTP